ncbi:MAG: DUF3325 domain-containing protein [Burkholderiales bacterium]|nr:DUF3325 domain-containing protein [Burkholderiales bacterium]
MRDAVTFLAAILAGTAGHAWLALAMNVHWRQVRGPHPASPRTVLVLRALGTAGLGASLALCLAVDHPSMAVPVWVMILVAAALAVAFTLAWRPRALAPLLAWIPPRKAQAGE